MQENNFEKQVQQKMDELSLSPSADVWQKLSVSIAKEKSNRRFFIVILLLLLMISSTVYLVFNSRSNKENQLASSQESVSVNIKSSSHPVTEKGVNKKGDDTKSRENTDSGLIVAGAQQQRVLITQNENAGVQTKAKGVENVAPSSQKNSKSMKDNLKATTDDKAKKIVYKTKKQLKVIAGKNAGGDLISVDVSSINSADKEEFTDREIKKGTYPINDFVTDPARFNVAGNGTTISVVQLSDSFVQLITTANRKEFIKEKKTAWRKSNGWNFGINFSLGASTTQAGLLGIGPGSSDASKAFADQAQNNPGGVPTGSPIGYVPSRIKTGAGILIGGFVQKNISTRSSVVLGLNFKMLNSSMKTGARVESIMFPNSNNFSNRNFYRNGSQQKFLNHFYFIELPVSVKIQLNNLEKAPVYLTTGINVARLIGSNALQFDVTSGTYFRDNSLMNKTQWSGTLGVLFLLNAKRANPILVGPEIQYSFNKMADAGLYKNRHYSFIGLTIQKTIGKK